MTRFTSSRGARSSGSKSARVKVRRPETYRPRLDALEERLQPGDTLLGGILGWSLIEAGAASWNPAPSGKERLHTAARTWDYGLAISNGIISQAANGVPATLFSDHGSLTPAQGQAPPASNGLAAAGEGPVWDVLQGVFPEVSHPRRVLRPDDWAFFSSKTAIPSGHGDGGTVSGPPVTLGPRPEHGSWVAGSGGVSGPMTGGVGGLPAQLAVSPEAGNDAGPDDENNVHALFNLSSPRAGPFPSDRFTVADHTQNTNRRINLPLPDPATRLSDYEDTQVLNTLDGFNMQPRLSIPFDGPIDVSTVNSHTVFMISLGDTLNHHDHGGQVVGINQVVWDVTTTTLHVESDQLLDQHTRYALIATDAVQDQRGHAVEPAEAFRHFRQTVHGAYREELLDAVHAARRLGVRERDIVTASVFTTESATAVLEKIRDQIHAATPAPADFNLGPDGARTVFSRDDVTGITFHEQTMADPPGFTDVQLTANLAALNYIPGAVSEIAFGKYSSPDYEVHPGEYIPPVGTRTGTPAVQGVNDIYFNLFLPSGPKPEGGWPVAIFGHGTNGSKDQGSFIAAMLAEHGVATIAINAVGHGFGPLGTLTVNSSAGGPVTFAAGGRGIDQNGDHIIGSNEGLTAAPPRTVVGNSDGQRQTTADLMQLVRVIEVGMDVHGDGQQDLDPSRIYCVGWSLGASYVTDFLAVEPEVRAGMINAVGINLATLELSTGGRSGLGMQLASRTPSLVNYPGIAVLGGLNVSTPRFDENMPLRNGIPLPVTLEDGTTRIIQSPVTNTVPGAMAIQEVLDNIAWVSQAGISLAYAPHLRKAPLTGVPAKSVIFQVNKGDQSNPNPGATAILRAGDLADRTTFYRHDLAHDADPTIPTNPHRVLISPTDANLLFATVARGYQRQIANFFAWDGQIIDDLADVTTPDGTPLFEVPIVGPLPEDLNYIV